MEAIINIQGEIGEEVTFMDVLTAIESAKGATSYTFIIDSIGGYVDEGFRIARLIEGLDLPTKTVAKTVYSIANIIFFAGSKREAQEGAEFMLHMAWFQPPAGNADDLKAWAEMLEREDRRIREYIEEKTGISQGKLVEVMKNDTYISNDQAQALGFYNQAKRLRVAAKYIRQEKNSLKTNIDMAEETKAKGLLDQIKALLNIEAKAEEVANMPDEEELVEQDDSDMAEMKAENERLKLQIAELTEKLQKAMEDGKEEEEKMQAKLEESKGEYKALLDELQGIKKHLTSNAQVVKPQPSFGAAEHNANYQEEDEPYAKAKAVALDLFENNEKYKKLLGK